MSKPDPITATGDGGSYAPCPADQHRAVCVDVIDLGEKVEQYQDNPEKILHKIVIVHQVEAVNPETDKRYEIGAEFTLSMGEKANLRKHLESWRGRPYLPTEIIAGVALDKLVGVSSLIQVAHKTSKAGRTYGIVQNIIKLPKGLEPLEGRDYERSAHWAKRKEEYKKGVDQWRIENVEPEQPPKPNFNDFPEAIDEDDSLPFDLAPERMMARGRVWQVFTMPEERGFPSEEYAMDFNEMEQNK